MESLLLPQLPTTQHSRTPAKGFFKAWLSEHPNKHSWHERVRVAFNGTRASSNSNVLRHFEAIQNSRLLRFLTNSEPLEDLKSEEIVGHGEVPKRYKRKKHKCDGQSRHHSEQTSAPTPIVPAISPRNRPSSVSRRRKKMNGTLLVHASERISVRNSLPSLRTLRGHESERISVRNSPSSSSRRRRKGHGSAPLGRLRQHRKGSASDLVRAEQQTKVETQDDQIVALEVATTRRESVWRQRQARKRYLKARTQIALETAAATRIESVWRNRQASRRQRDLKAQQATFCDAVAVELRKQQTIGDPQTDWDAAVRLFTLLSSAASVSLSFSAGPQADIPSDPVLSGAWSRALELRASAAAALDRSADTFAAAIATSRDALAMPELVGTGKPRAALQRQITTARTTILGTLLAEGPSITAEADDGISDQRVVTEWMHTDKMLRARCVSLFDNATALLHELEMVEEQTWEELKQAKVDLEQHTRAVETLFEANSKPVGDGNSGQRGTVTLVTLEAQEADLQAAMTIAGKKGVGQESLSYEHAASVVARMSKCIAALEAIEDQLDDCEYERDNGATTTLAEIVNNAVAAGASPHYTLVAKAWTELRGMRGEICTQKLQELLHRVDAAMVVSADEVREAIKEALEAGICTETSKIYFDAAELLSTLEQQERDQKHGELNKTFEKKQRERFRLHRHNSMRASGPQMQAAWVKLYTRADSGPRSFYYYNQLSLEITREMPMGFDPTAKSKLDADLTASMGIQAVFRGYNVRNQVKQIKIQQKLQSAILEARKTRDAVVLMKAIETALDQGLDDESSVYFDAGEMVISLEDKSAAQLADKIGTEWMQLWDASSGDYYYHNTITNETSWDMPKCFEAKTTNKQWRAVLPPRLRLLLRLQTLWRGPKPSNGGDRAA